MKKTITKWQIVQALKTEPLIRNQYFKAALEYNMVAYRENCPVCAVGAILRHMSFEKWARKEGIGLHKLGCIATCEFSYLGKLSDVYEQIAKEDGIEVARTRSIAFVKKHFPAKITLELSKKDFE